MTSASPFYGSGPGARTLDGCSVELYRQLPYLGDLDEVLPVLPAGASVLELGCGTGTLCARLAGAGHRVTGVDQSAEMLAHLPVAVTGVCSTIEALDLQQTFDAVLLASNLINHPSAESRKAFVACARRHLERGGLFFLERHDPEWLETVQPGRVGAAGAIELHVESVTRDDSGVRMTLRYQAPTGTWRHSFEAVPLDEGHVERLLERTGFAEVRWFGKARRWASAIAQ